MQNNSRCHGFPSGEITGDVLGRYQGKYEYPESMQCSELDEVLSTHALLEPPWLFTLRIP